MHNHNMQTLTTITSDDPSDITSLVRDLTHATISPMPRRDRAVPDTPVLQALDNAVREYDEAEALLKAKDAKLREAIVEAAREAADKDSRLTIQHIAERVGWTRETINRIATKAGVRQRPAKGGAHPPTSGG
jgi:hypothetical protein